MRFKDLQILKVEPEEIIDIYIQGVLKLKFILDK